jgi:predicted metalloprotease
LFGPFCLKAKLIWNIMQWFGRRESSNTEDGSASGGRGLALGGGVMGIIAAAIYFFTGVDPSAILNQVQTSGGAPQENNQAAIPDTKEKKFAKVVLPIRKTFGPSFLTIWVKPMRSLPCTFLQMRYQQLWPGRR